MGTISQIDTDQPLVFYPSITGKVDVPEMVQLSNELQNPDLLNCDTRILGRQLRSNDVCDDRLGPQTQRR